MRLRSVPLTSDLLLALPTPVGISAERLHDWWREPHRRAEMLAQSRAVVVEGARSVPIAAWGVLKRRERVYTAWAWLTSSCAASALAIVRQARMDLSLAHDRLGARRIQAEVACELPSGVRFAERIGFELEGRLRCYGPEGQGDHFMLASVRPCSAL